MTNDDGLQLPWKRAGKSKSQRQEERIGNMRGGQKQNNSGRFWRWPRDAKLHDFLVEARTTDAKSYSIKYEEFQQLAKQAYRTPPGCQPAMQIDIRDLQLFVTKLSDYEALRDRLLYLEGLHGEETFGDDAA